MSDSPTAPAASGMVARLDYPMWVVTAASGDEVSGCLAGFVTQCSVEPARFFVCISKKNHTFGVASRASALGLHLLGEEQHDLAHVFGELTGDSADKFAVVDWHPGSTGAPVLAASAAWIEGPVLERVDVGDHMGHLVEPVAGGGGGSRGQLLYSAVRHLDPGHPAVEH